MRKEQERVIREAMRWYRSHIKEPYGYRVEVALWKACAALAKRKAK
jgi:hypothetical protein